MIYWITKNYLKLTFKMPHFPLQYFFFCNDNAKKGSLLKKKMHFFKHFFSLIYLFIHSFIQPSLRDSRGPLAIFSFVWAFSASFSSCGEKTTSWVLWVLKIKICIPLTNLYIPIEEACKNLTGVCV